MTYCKWEDDQGASGVEKCFRAAGEGGLCHMHGARYVVGPDIFEPDDRAKRISELAAELADARKTNAALCEDLRAANAREAKTKRLRWQRIPHEDGESVALICGGSIVAKSGVHSSIFAECMVEDLMDYYGLEEHKCTG